MVPCNTCASGELVPRRKYRSSVVVVLIGYLLLVPSLAGLVFGTMGLLEPRSTPESRASADWNAIQHLLQGWEVPARVIDAVHSLEDCAPEELAALSEEQRETVAAARRSWSVRRKGAGGSCLGDPWLLLVLMSLTGAILGWCCVLKKTVFQCVACRSTE